MKCYLCDVEGPIETEVERGYGFHQRTHTVTDGITELPSLTLNGKSIAVHDSCNKSIDRSKVKSIPFSKLNPGLYKLYRDYVAGKVDLGLKVHIKTTDVEQHSPMKCKAPNRWRNPFYGN